MTLNKKRLNTKNHFNKSHSKSLATKGFREKGAVQPISPNQWEFSLSQMSWDSTGSSPSLPGLWLEGKKPLWSSQGSRQPQGLQQVVRGSCVGSAMDPEPCFNPVLFHPSFCFNCDPVYKFQIVLGWAPFASFDKGWFKWPSIPLGCPPWLPKVSNPLPRGPTGPCTDHLLSTGKWPCALLVSITRWTLLGKGSVQTDSLLHPPVVHPITHSISNSLNRLSHRVPFTVPGAYLVCETGSWNRVWHPVSTKHILMNENAQAMRTSASGATFPAALLLEGWEGVVQEEWEDDVTVVKASDPRLT